MQKKLIALYIMFFILISLGVFSLWQFVLPMFENTSGTGENYDFTELQNLVEVSGAETDGNTSIQYDAETLFKQNPDFAGWLIIPDTTISFPIVQGSDNSFYLNHSFNKSYSSYGCPFIDIRTPVDGDNVVVHGHNMGNNRKEMFSPLLLFQNPEYALQHKTACFSAYPSDTEVQYELFAVVNFKSDKEFNYFFSEFKNETHRNDYVQFLKKHSLYKSEFVPDGDVLVLSTCNRTYGKDNRLLLCFGEIKQ